MPWADGINMNYVTLADQIKVYTQNYETSFVANIPVFVKQAEARVYNTVQIPALRKNVTGNVSTSNKYLTCPLDFLSAFSLAVVDSTGSYEYLLNKDVNFLRQAYPNPNDTGLPQYYALFGPRSDNLTDLTFIIAPTPNASYVAELHYYYYPASIVQGYISVLGSLTGGTGYTNGVHYNVPLTGGSGADATATVVVAGGAIVEVTLENAGSLYTVGNVLSADAAYIGTGNSFTITVTAINNPTGTSWLGDNYDPALLYGALVEAYVFMKGEADMMSYYEKKFQDALAQLKRLGDGLERGDAYRDGQAKVKVT